MRQLQGEWKDIPVVEEKNNNFQNNIQSFKSLCFQHRLWLSSDSCFLLELWLVIRALNTQQKHYQPQGSFTLESSVKYKWVSSPWDSRGAHFHCSTLYFLTLQRIFFLHTHQWDANCHLPLTLQLSFLSSEYTANCSQRWIPFSQNKKIKWVLWQLP